MKTQSLKYCSAVLLLLMITACKKVINLDLGDVSGELVIEGNVTNASGPQTVKLSRNVAFTSTNTYPAVTGANVAITDGLGNTYPLTENPAGTYSTMQPIGHPGETYSLAVTTGGKSYTAKSTMPAIVALDSISAKPDIFNADKGQRIITVHFQDPGNIPNQYRFIMYVNGVQVKSVFAFDDEFIDGKYVDLDLEQTDTKIYPKDTVDVEMQCIDKPVYTYWYTLAQQQVTNPGGQVAPANPPTNITPTTLGYFSAHTSQRLTIIVK
ncbi:MAG: DUF4249 domain-containing protein [Mucilaginibacter sp.]